MSDEKEKIILYGPVTGKSLLKSYPELAEDAKFKNISGEDLLFAWYVGCASSPIDPEWSDQTRYRTAVSKAFNNSTGKDKRDRYASGDIPDETKQAIEKFRQMSPDARLLAKRMVQTIFDKYQQMVDVDVQKDFVTIRTIGKGDDKEEVKEVDWAGKKSYIDSMAKISETIPSLIDQIEKGFGVTETKKNEEKLGTKSIDRFHQNKKTDK